MTGPKASTEEQAGLIPCPSCDRQISTDADACPGCGGINTWVHPKLQQVTDYLGGLDRVTHYEVLGHRMHLSTTIQNQRQRIGTRVLFTSVALLPIGLFSPLFLTLALLLLIVGGLMIGGGLNATQTYELDLDMRTPRKVVGRCDQVFWSDVLKLVRS